MSLLFILMKFLQTTKQFLYENFQGILVFQQLRGKH